MTTYCEPIKLVVNTAEPRATPCRYQYSATTQPLPLALSDDWQPAQSRDRLIRERSVARSLYEHKYISRSTYRWGGSCAIDHCSQMQSFEKSLIFPAEFMTSLRRCFANNFYITPVGASYFRVTNLFPY